MKNQKKGQAGLTVLLAVIGSLFVIGIVIMAFSLTGAKLVETSANMYETNGTVRNEENKTVNDTTAATLAVNSYRSVACNIEEVKNQSLVIAAANYSVTNCVVTKAATTFNNTVWKIRYNYTWEIPGSAYRAINDTTRSLGDATDFFPIYITVAGVVVIVLLIVLIFAALRGSGMMGEMGGGSSGGKIGGKEGA